MQACYGDYQLVAACLFQLKAKFQLNIKSQQEFAGGVAQLAQWALVRLPMEFIQKEATYAFVSRVRDCELKQQHLIGSDRSLSENLIQALKLKAVKAAA